MDGSEKSTSLVGSGIKSSKGWYNILSTSLLYSIYMFERVSAILT